MNFALTEGGGLSVIAFIIHRLTRKTLMEPTFLGHFSDHEKGYFRIFFRTKKIKPSVKENKRFQHKTK